MEFVVLTAEEDGLELVPLPDRGERRCDECARSLDASPDAVYRVEVGSADLLVDLMHAAPMYVAGPAFSDWVEQQQLAGLKFEPLEAHPTLARVRAAQTAQLAPGSVKIAEACDTCGRRTYTVVGPWELEEASWDGSAFFTLRERDELIFCTAAAAEALQESGLKGPFFLAPELMA